MNFKYIITNINVLNSTWKPIYRGKVELVVKKKNSF